MSQNNICPLCNQESDFKFLKSHFDATGNQEYRLYECAKCQVWFWQPLKNPGARWYETDQRYSGRNADPNLNPIWNYKKIISFLKPLAGRVLDVGCGTGNFLAYAQKNGWQASGIDFDREAIKTAKEIFKLNQVEAMDLNEYYEKNNGKKFDLITFFDVFEHLDNHREFIDLVKKMLKDKGYIALTLPDRQRADWLMAADAPPRHLTRWDENSIKNFLLKNGFQILYLARQSAGLEHILMKLRFRYGGLFSMNLVKKYKDKKRNEGEKILPGSQIQKNAARLQTLARIKDWIIFGLPALIIWLAMFPDDKKYLNLYVIAQKVE